MSNPHPIKYWLGKKRHIPPEVRAKQVLARKGEKAYNWKGDKVSYSGLHHWLKRELGLPKKCQNKNCKYPRKRKDRTWLMFPKRFEWANISGKYLRDKSDYISLCSSCHKKWDLKLIKIEI